MSNTHDGGKLLSTACGSPCYAAPEMIAGKRYVGPLADIWSIGVILFALVCGYLPFEDPNTSNLYKKIMAGQYKPAKWISPEVRDLIRKVLEIDPEKRFKIADIRQHPWYTAVSDEEVPKDLVVSQVELEAARNEAFQGITDAGLDKQAVLDGLASKACNALTATFYLLEQRAKKRRLKMIDQNTNGGTSSGTTVAVSSAGTSGTTGAASSTGLSADDQQPKRSIPNKIPPTVTNHKPQTQVQTALVPIPIIPSSTDQKPPSGRIIEQKPNGRVPKLNLQAALTTQNNQNNADVINLKSIMASNDGLVSQTARPLTSGSKYRDESVKQQTSQTARLMSGNNDIVKLDYTMGGLRIDDDNNIAVTPAPLDLMGDTPADDRPSTRRSRMRSRGAETTTGEENMYAPAGFEEGDKLYNVPITISSDGGNMLPVINGVVRFPPQVHSQAPQAPKPSSGIGGRRGKHMTQKS